MSVWDALSRDQVVLKLILSILLGGLVGLEREIKGRPAGIRTHVLVCLGSAILIIGARHAASFPPSGIGGQIVFDPNRLAAGIMTGIGFLGAGAILRTGDLVRGLTTGACVWFVAALGIVIGNGLYPLAGVATVTVLLVLEVFDLVEHRIPPIVYRALVVKMPLQNRDRFDAWCRDLLAMRRIRIQETLIHLDAASGSAQITYRIRVRGAVQTRQLVEEISLRPEVSEVGVDQE